MKLFYALSILNCLYRGYAGKLMMWLRNRPDDIHSKDLLKRLTLSYFTRYIKGSFRACTLLHA